MKIRPEHEYKKEYALSKANDQQPNLGQGSQLKLMPFQVSSFRCLCRQPDSRITYQIDGFNWLCDNWWRLQHCILADEMGLVMYSIEFISTIIQLPTGENRPNRNVSRQHHGQMEGLSCPCCCAEFYDHELGSRIRESALQVRCAISV